MEVWASSVDARTEFSEAGPEPESSCGDACGELKGEPLP